MSSVPARQTLVRTPPSPPTEAVQEAREGFETRGRLLVEERIPPLSRLKQLLEELKELLVRDYCRPGEETIE